MERDIITMSKKQLNRFEVLSKANDGFITVREASEVLGLSERQVQRLKKKVRLEGAAGVIHKNTGRQPTHKIPDETKARILEIRSRPEFEKCNFRHFQELLAIHYGIEISYGTLHSLLLESGIKSPKTKRRAKPHRRRKRKPQAGLMLQTDASPFRWLPGDRMMYSLHGAIDDATSQVTGLYLCKNECLHGYFEMLRRTIHNYGIPKSMYADRHTIFQSPNAKKHEIDQTVPMNDTQFGRCLKELGTTLIGARSAQAKGRVERLWETLQSRIPVELAIRGIATVEAANEFLESYVFDFNAEFAVEPENAQNMFRKPAADDDLDNILCIKENRVADGGGVFSYGNKSFKIVDTEGTIPVPAKAQIQVLVSSRIGIRSAWRGSVYEVLPYVPPKRKRKKSTPPHEARKTAPPTPDHIWRTGLHKHIGVFDGYEAEDEYRETILMLERMLLGKGR